MRVSISATASALVFLVVVSVSACADRVDSTPLAGDASPPMGDSTAGESGDESSGSETGGEGIDVAAPCDPSEEIPGMPFAIAWREYAADGTEQLEVHLQSYEAHCGDRDRSPPSGQSKITLRVAVGDLPQDQLDLLELETLAVLKPGGPGSNASVTEIAFLRGQLDLGVETDGTIVGTLRDSSERFSGCFVAPICPQ